MSTVIAGYRPTVTQKIASQSGSTPDNREATVFQFPNGNWIMAYHTLTPPNYSLGATINVRFSGDKGATWTAENTYLDGNAVTGFPLTLAGTGLSGSQGPGEPWFVGAPNGDLWIYLWYSDFSTNNKGTWGQKCTDGLGKVWGSVAQVNFAGLPAGYVNSTIFMTDDGFTDENNIMYQVARRPPSGDAGIVVPVESLLFKSSNNGATWTYVANISLASQLTVGTIECGLAYLGNNTMFASLRPQLNAATTTLGYGSWSYDMGATWNGGADNQHPGVPTNLTYMAGHIGRPRIRSVKRLKGQANWWTDTNWIMVGFAVNDTQRTPCVWVSRDSCVTWSRPIFLFPNTSGQTDQCYGDIIWDSTRGEYVVLTGMYNLATSNHVIRQFNFKLNGF